MQIDYHTHHERCGHAVGRLEAYVKAALEKGIDQLGLSDHMPLLHVDPQNYLPEMAMPMDELPVYVEECFALQQKYKGQIDIRVGLEGDYIEGQEEKIMKIIDMYPWDYVIGSVHFLGTWDITDYRQQKQWQGKHIYAVYEQYYDALQKAAKTGFYDFLGHIDVIKRFGYIPQEDTTALELGTLDVIAETGTAIELNASGSRMPVNEMFPAPSLVKEAASRSIVFTLGSDAHKPEQVSFGLEKARQQLAQAGVEQLATFKQRQRQMVSLR